VQEKGNDDDDVRCANGRDQGLEIRCYCGGTFANGWFRQEAVPRRRRKAFLWHRGLSRRPPNNVSKPRPPEHGNRSLQKRRMTASSFCSLFGARQVPVGSTLVAVIGSPLSASPLRACPHTAYRAPRILATYVRRQMTPLSSLRCDSDVGNMQAPAVCVRACALPLAFPLVPNSRCREIEVRCR
jgi:hypothetical protein